MSKHQIERRAFLFSSGLTLSGLGLAAGENGHVNPASDRIVSNSGGSVRDVPKVEHNGDFVVVGGGLAGVCAAITAARAGLKVVLVQDRPVLGGNASSEIRLWVLGATAHLDNNNRWAREGGIHEEIIVENLYRNREGNPVFFDALLLEKVWAEPNITLLLNTAVDHLEMLSPDRIGKVYAYCSQNSTRYEISAPIYCDCSGDGIVGYLSGAAFRVGAESAEEFGEKFVMPPDYGTLLGHSMYFYSKDTGQPVKYVPPAFALKDIPKNLPHFKRLRRDSSGCRLWWLEWGDDQDRVFGTEKIRDELCRVVYGVWDYIKNSGDFKDVENLTLEWVGTIPGKRESRRFEGDYILTQQDIIEQKPFKDAIAHGGWAIDLHPGKGVYSTYPCCTQYHSKGVYTIPYRSIYSRNITNLFFGGRLISVSHVAFGSTRVISTGTLCAQAAAWAAVLCRKYDVSPRELGSAERLHELQRLIQLSGQYIPTLELNEPNDLVKEAELTASSTLELSGFPASEDASLNLSIDSAMLFPFPKGKVPRFTFIVSCKESTTLEAEFCVGMRKGNYTPDRVLSRRTVSVEPGNKEIVLDFDVELEEPRYGLVVLKKNPKLSVMQSESRMTGVLSVFNRRTQRVNEKHGVEGISFFTPKRRPEGKNIACKMTPPIRNFGTEQLSRGLFRPASDAVNAWIASPTDSEPTLKAVWKEKKTIRKIILWFDTDFDHPMESCLMGHPEDIVPFCVRKYTLLDDQERVICQVSDNRHSRCEITLELPLDTSSLTLKLEQEMKNVPVSLFGWQAFA